MGSKQGESGRLRAPDGRTLEYPDIPTVQEWIVQGRVERGFKIYDAKKRRWRPIEDLPDLDAFIRLREASAPWEQAHSRYLSSRR